MEGERVLIHLDISALCVRDQDASSTPENGESLVVKWKESIYLSVASLSFSMAFRSSVLPAADRLVMGVVAELP